MEGEEVRALLARHGLPIAEPVLAPRQGDANRTYLVGSLVVRLARPAILEDWRTECLAHPYVHAQGIRTPRLVAHGEFYTVLERVAGRNMHERASETFFRSLGAQLARLHTLPPPPDPDGVLEDMRRVAIDLSGLPTPLRPLATELRDVRDADGEDFVHGDLTMDNILVGPDDEAILLDWGDAGHGGAVGDFAEIPVAGLPAALDAYGADAAFRRRTVAMVLRAAKRLDEDGDSNAILRAVEGLPILERLVQI